MRGSFSPSFLLAPNMRLKLAGADRSSGSVSGCALAGTDVRPLLLRRRAGRPQLKRDPLGGSAPLRSHTRCVVQLAALAAFALARQLGAQTSDSTCVRQTEFVLGRVRLAALSAEVYDSLGKPLRQRRSSSEDDGGRYAVLQLTYAKLNVDIGRGDRVERLVTTSSALALHSGVRVGMTLSEVTGRLRLSQAAAQLRDETLNLSACLGDLMGDCGPEAALHLLFRVAPAGERRLVKIELSNYGP